MVRILKFKNLENLFKNFQNSGKDKITPIRVKFDKIEKISKQQQDYKEVEARAARARAENPNPIHRDDKLDEKNLLYVFYAIESPETMPRLL